MKVFIAHSSEDHYIAERISTALRRRNYTVFLDRDDLPVGNSFDGRIEVAIRKSDLVLFLISPSSDNPGSYTLTELKMTKDKWKNPSDHVLPLFIKRTPVDTIPAYLRAITSLKPQGDIVGEVLF